MSGTAATPSSPQDWETLAVHDWESDTELIVELAGVLNKLSSDDVPVLDEHVDAESLCNGLQAVEGRQFTEVRFSVDTHEVRIRQNGVIEAQRQLHSE